MVATYLVNDHVGGSNVKMSRECGVSGSSCGGAEQIRRCGRKKLEREAIWRGLPGKRDTEIQSLTIRPCTKAAKPTAKIETALCDLECELLLNSVNLYNYKLAASTRYVKQHRDALQVASASHSLDPRTMTMLRRLDMS